MIGRARSRDDPLVGINAKSYEVTQAIDDAVLGPVSRTYTKVLPRPIRSGMHNFLSNLHEPVVAINYLLQLKPGKAAETIGRFAVNTTLGVAGLFGAATKKPFRLPFRANGFANTFGYYGVKPGPVANPTTFRADVRACTAAKGTPNEANACGYVGRAVAATMARARPAVPARRSRR